MSWRTLMKAEKKPKPSFLRLQKTSTKSTKPPKPASEHPHEDNFVDIVDESKRSEESSPLCSIKPGLSIQFRIPRIVSPTNYEWEWHRGKIELIDERWQMALVIPETEQEPWRWVAMIYIKTGEND